MAMKYPPTGLVAHLMANPSEERIAASRKLLQNPYAYPRSESPGLSAITGTPGAIKPDEKKAEQCKTIKTTGEQDRKMSEFIVRATASPGTYRLTGNNCTNFVRSALQQANISTPVSPGPRPYFQGLPGK